MTGGLAQGVGTGSDEEGVQVVVSTCSSPGVQVG